jgi:hypothetical protein
MGVVVVPLFPDLYPNKGECDMSSQARWDALLSAVSPLTKDMLLRWLLLPWSLIEHLADYEPGVQCDILMELQQQGVIRWSDGIPFLSIDEGES